jgi:hypothetical protein
MSEIQHSNGNVNNQILLIGNGPSVLDFTYGNEINKFETVVRFNIYRIDGFEKYVGTKCDIWITCLTKPWIVDRMHLFKKIYFPLVQDHYIKLLEEIPNSECIPHSIYKKVSMMNGKYFYPSSGLLASAFFIDLGFDVILHGFDFFQKPKHHYGDNVTMGSNHSPENELMAFNKLLNGGKVKFLNDIICKI